MINLEDHIVEVNGVKMVPYDIAIQAANNGSEKLTGALNLIQQSLQQFNEIKKDIND